MGRIGYTFAMMRSSWEVLKKDKELLLFPLLSGFCCLLVMLSFALPMLLTDYNIPAENATTQQKALGIAILFMYYFINYFVIIFFNSAIVACAIYRMRGGNPDFFTGFNAAAARLPQILGWAFVSATVGLLLRMLQNRRNKLGRILIGLIGMAWSIATFLVIPVLVVERKGPIEAVKSSMALLKKTWGHQLIGNFGFGLIFFLLSLIGIVPIALGVMSSLMFLKVLLIILGVTYLITLALVQSALQTIFQAALYLYAHDGIAPEGFAADDLQSAVGN
jgi:hypothetical protein